MKRHVWCAITLFVAIGLCGGRAAAQTKVADHPHQITSGAAEFNFFARRPLATLYRPGFRLRPIANRTASESAPVFTITPLVAGPNLPVVGSGIIGRLPKWTALTSGNSVLGNSTIFEDKFGLVGIGTDTPTSRLTVLGLIESKGAGGVKFPDGTVQTTAALSSIFHDTTLSGNGSAAMPLGVAIPLKLNAVSGLDAVVTISNTAPGGEGLQSSGGDNASGIGGAGLVGSGGDSTSGTGGKGLSALGGNSNMGIAGEGVLAMGGASTSGTGGAGVRAIGGTSGGFFGGTGVFATGADSANGSAGIGVRANGGDSGLAGGTGVSARGGRTDDGRGGTGMTADGGEGNGATGTGGTGVEARGGDSNSGMGGTGLTAFPGSGSSGFGLAGRFSGDVEISGTLSKSSGSFKIDHPLDPENKYLYHSFVESPDMKNIYDGNTVTDANGEATIELPAYFEALNRDFRYQLTVVGTFAQAIVAEEVKGNHFRIRTSAPNVKVSWQVTGIRQDGWANRNRIKVEVDKPERERGYYLHPEAFDQTEERGIEWARNPEMMQQRKAARERAKHKRQ